jgi:hypothetical protein
VTAYTSADLARWWAALASLGAALVSLALARERFGAGWPAAALLLAVCAYQAGWAVLAFARDAMPLPGLTVLVNVAVALVLALGAGSVFAALLMLLVVAGVLAARSGRCGAVRRSAGGYLAAMGVGALVVAAVTTPALAATDAGQYARTHGGHQVGH